MNRFLHPRSIAVVAIFLLFVCFPIVISAIPAAPFPGKVVQPDGTTLTVKLTGDEFAHITVTTDGYTLVEETGGYYYAQAGTDGTLVSTGVLAHDPEDRQANETALLQNTPKGIRVKKEIKQPRRRLNKALLQSGAAGNDNVLVSGGYPLRGKTRSLVILVEFNDIDFVTPDTYHVFNDMLNKPGYDKREHIGCAADYFRIQSGGLFDPSFDVYGPVRASKASTYYGENDAAGDDMYVWELVLDVCRKLDDQINFADYDLDGDGTPDIYLKSKGETPSTKAPLVMEVDQDIYLSEGSYGYIEPHKDNKGEWNETRDYLYPIPTDDRSLTGGALTQNPGWNDGLDF